MIDAEAALESLNSGLWVCIWAVGITLLMIAVAYLWIGSPEDS